MPPRDKQSRPYSNLSAAELPTPTELLDTFVHFVRQQFRVLLTAFVFSIAVGVAYLAVARSSYVAVAMMLIESHRPSFFQPQQAVMNSGAQLDAAAVESQVIVLKSDSIALSVIKKLRLNEDPEFVGENSHDWMRSSYKALSSFISRHLSSLANRLAAIEGVEPDAPIAGASNDWLHRTLRAILAPGANRLPPTMPNDSGGHGGATLRNEVPGNRNNGGSTEAANRAADAFGTPAAEYLAMRQALDVFKSRLTVKRDTVSFVIEVGFRSYDPEKAAQIANAIVDASITDQLDARYQATIRTSDWLNDRLRELGSQASASQQAVVDYQHEHNIIDAAGKSTNSQRVSELNSQLIIARTQTAEARARLDRVQTVLSSDSSGAVDATVTDTLKNDVITRLRAQYLDLARREAEWAAKYGADHLAVANLRSQMTETRVAILDELRRVAESYKSDLEIATARASSAQKEYDQAVAQAEQGSQAQVILSDLESKSKTYRALYENFLQRYMDSVQQQSFPIPEGRLISPAARPLQRSSPKTFVTLAISACVGILLGFAIGVVRDLWDRAFRTSEQVEQILRVPCVTLVPRMKNAVLGTLPSITPPREVSIVPAMRTANSSAEVALLHESYEGQLSFLPSEEKLPSRSFAHDSRVFWRSVDAPFTRFAEAIRAIKVAIDLNRGGRSSEVLGFTSSLPNEGKSTLAASLALLIAQTGGRVILVDCDLRNPSLTRMLAPSAKKGLLEVVSHDFSLDEVLWWSDPRLKLPFLPATNTGHLLHTNEILASLPVKQLFDELRKHYEYIIVDLSPLAPVVDVRMTTHFVDSYLYVIEWGATKVDVVKKAMADAPAIYENLLGAVLNKTDISKLRRYEAHRKVYYENKHYSRYGLS